jgi:hypothetical protein
MEVGHVPAGADYCVQQGKQKQIYTSILEEIEI